MTDNAAYRPSAFGTIVYGGLAVGVLDFLDANLFFGWWLGAGPQRVWWSVASGLIGRDRAINGGIKTMLLGIFLHFVVAFIIATVFYLGCLVIPALIRHPVIWGLLYGVVCYFVMSFVVVPNSRAAQGNAPVLFSLGLIVVRSMPLSIFLNGILGHAFLVGLPVALCARRSARPARR